MSSRPRSRPGSGKEPRGSTSVCRTRHSPSVPSRGCTAPGEGQLFPAPPPFSVAVNSLSESSATEMNRGTLVTTMTELLISSDSHAQLSHEKVKAHLASKHHDAYDKAVAAFAAEMAGGPAKITQ